MCRCYNVITQYWKSNNFHHQKIGRQNKKLEIKYVPESLRRRLFMTKMRRRPDFLGNKMRYRQDCLFDLLLLLETVV